MSKENNSVEELNEEVQEEQIQQDIIYFVSYYSSQGMGNTEVTMLGEIVNAGQIAEIEQLIEKDFGLDNVKVINFFPIRLQNQDTEGE